MKGLLVCALLVISACDGGSVAMQPMGPVVFIGDSITERWGVPAAADPTLEVLVPHSINAGVDGQTSWQMLARFSTDVLSAHPGIVVIEAGTNDLSEWGISHSQAFTGDPWPFPTVDSIASMAEQASASGARVLIASVIQTSMPQFNVSAGDVAAFNEALRALCHSYGYAYLDYQAALELRNGRQNSSDFIYDQVHPNEAGFHAMWIVLDPYL